MISEVMQAKKILYIKAQWVGDMISGIPFLVEMKKQWHEVRQVFYDMNALMYLYDPRKLFSPTYRKALRKFKQTPMAQGRGRVLDIFRKQGLIKDILFIPLWCIGLLRVLIKYHNFFDEAVVTIGTRPAKRLARRTSKTVRVVFAHTNDKTVWRITAEGELGYMPDALYTYHDALSLPAKAIDLPASYAAIFPSLFERSPEMAVRKEIITFLHKKNIVPVIIGWSREDRFVQELKSHHLSELVIDMIDKTTFEEMVWIVQHSQVNILCNGGVMRVANLVNQRNINIHTVSAFLMEPPVDNKYSFNLRPYLYPECSPCEAWWRGETWEIRKCVFYNTGREGECRQTIHAAMIVKLTKNILSTLEN